RRVSWRRRLDRWAAVLAGDELGGVLGGLPGGFLGGVAHRLGILGRYLAGGGLRRLGDDGGNAFQKRLLARARELLDGLIEGQPLHRLDVASRAPCTLTD